MKLYKFIILILTIFILIGCSDAYIKHLSDNNCKQHSARHYDAQGNYTGTTYWMECD